YLRAERMDKSIVESIYQVFHDVGSAIIFTSVVLSVGFGIFVFSDFQYSVRFGVAIAFTMIVALVFDLLFLPALLLLKADKSTFKAEKEQAESLYAAD
ncbi:MAG TPA: RND family transporter, partial [Spirochaetes bacterium]|nr:RND family transporter [Spirochaetota bacterium]